MFNPTIQLHETVTDVTDTCLQPPLDEQDSPFGRMALDVVHLDVRAPLRNIGGHFAHPGQKSLVSLVIRMSHRPASIRLADRAPIAKPTSTRQLTLRYRQRNKATDMCIP